MDTLATGDGTVGPNSSRRGTGDAIRLLPLTCRRRSELQTVHWEYVRDCIRLPDAMTDGLEALHPDNATRKGDNPWVIADRLPGSHLNQAATPLASHRCEPVWGI